MLTGVILAGGKDRRMQGNPKALLPFGPEKLIQRQLRLMQPVCSELIVVTNDPKPFLRLLEPEIRIITDFVPNQGPLGGMHAGLSLARNRDVWLVGNHMPFISSQAAELLQERKHEGFDAALPLVQGGIYPLHGIYDRSCADLIWSLLQGGEPTLNRFLKVLYWGELHETIFQENGIGSGFIESFSRQEEYERLLRQYDASFCDLEKFDSSDINHHGRL
ncbi:molybdenum cofactor guanylyltransferase [Paenibacillus filicis]|uniref:Molybdenum cofactor guanylyltransferase n=1 Tax=Paenibacillus gyeongsangnamensis TaxID=3388067 RepID=A0ABT4QD36_9BACL|nr:molybdenum cofactor guanylyltransferase [Paenibacillus filicis]MCZ8514794.1 molybdenum cofactor guanylyltransferase [Paenibacillus filicis]